MNIFLNADLLTNDSQPEPQRLKELVDLLHGNSVRFYLSSNVLLEIEKWHQDFASENQAHSADLEKRVQNPFQYYEALIHSGTLEIIDFPEGLIQETVRRSIWEQLPFTGKSQNGFRNAVTWLTYSKYAEENDLHDCFFVSEEILPFCGETSPEKTTHEVSASLKIDSERFLVCSSLPHLTRFLKID